MGPCLFRHGKTGALADLPALTNYLLQWGHVFSDMVRQGCPGDRDLRLRASMGPCLFRHGKHLQPGPPPKVILMTLQWGHVFSDMVRTGIPIEWPFMLRLLQWGHVFSDMVRLGQDLIQAGLFVGFNGAMSFQTW